MNVNTLSLPVLAKELVNNSVTSSCVTLETFGWRQK